VRSRASVKVEELTIDRHLMVWGSWGAYHHARFAAFRAACGAADVDAHGLELFRFSADYAWPADESPALVSLDLGGSETEFPGVLALGPAARHIRRLRPTVVFLPAYHHWSLALNVIARIAGARVVIMSDTTRSTARPGGLRRLARIAAVRTAGAMLVGGTSHRRYFTELGVPTDKIFDGYDAIDNEAFERIADEARRLPDETRRTIEAPTAFFLTVARLVPKKSLHTLLDAYALVRADAAMEDAPALVLIGSGPLRGDLERQARELGLPLGTTGLMFVDTFDEERIAAAMGLAIALVLPSTVEEWGLVVNEAMAAGCPVIVSRAAGCVEDLVEDGVTGVLFDPGDAVSLAEHMVIIQGDPALRERLATSAGTRIAEWGCERFARNALLAAGVSRSGRGHLSRIER
jgi:glycosyltransferase involved in cell wall biosynthesis